jgi:hypothetical protein
MQALLAVVARAGDERALQSRLAQQRNGVLGRSVSCIGE